MEVRFDSQELRRFGDDLVCSVHVSSSLEQEDLRIYRTRTFGMCRLQNVIYFLNHSRLVFPSVALNSSML